MLHFENEHELCITVDAAENVLPGRVCNFDGAHHVTRPSSGAFTAVCRSVRNGKAAVLLHGLVTLPYTGATAPTQGYKSLISDADGNVSVGSGGNEYLVVDADTANKTVTFLLN